MTTDIRTIHHDDGKFDVVINGNLYVNCRSVGTESKIHVNLEAKSFGLDHVSTFTFEEFVPEADRIKRLQTDA